MNDNNQDKNVVAYNDDVNNNKTSKMNLPNKLTIFRIVLVPVIMIFILLPENTWAKLVAAALFLIASVTDFVDGILARKLNLITDFGKLMDPLADKFMVVGAMIAITAANSFEPMGWFTVWATTIVFFRELAVTSIRLIAKSADGNVIAANFSAKIKTVSQIVCIMTILLEDAILTNNLNTPPYLFSYITMGFMLLMTLYSGFVYFKTYWKYIDPSK